MKNGECCEQIVLLIGELHKRIKRMQAHMMTEYHISLQEYHILVIMMKAKQLTQNELAEALDVDKALVSRLIRTMQDKELLYCAPDPDCRRKNTLLLSEKAMELIPQLEELHSLSLERIFADIDSEQLEQLQNILEGLLRKI